MGDPENTGRHTAIGTESAAALLRHAQRVADELRAGAEAEAVSLTAQARAHEAETARIRTLAGQERESAQRTLTLAEQQFSSATDDARKIVADAADQARDLIRAAESQAQTLLSESEQASKARLANADSTLEMAQLDAQRLITEAQRIRDEAQADADRMVLEARMRIDEDDAASHELIHRRTEAASVEATAMVTRAQAHADHMRSTAEVASEKLRVEAAELLTRARDEAETTRAEALAESMRLVSEAESSAKRQRQLASEHLEATRDQVERLKAAAAEERDQAQRAHHAELAKRVRHSHAVVQDIAARFRVRLTEEAIEREKQSLALAEQVAEEIRKHALAEAELIKDGAHRQGEQIVADAESAAAATEQRSQLRLHEAEESTKTLRRSVVDETARRQREVQEESRAIREGAMELLANARAEADRILAHARHMIDEAKDEVAALQERRNEITRELGQLSGIIQALAVPSQSGASGDVPADAEA